MVASVALILPDMDKGIGIANLGLPAANKMAVIGFITRNLRVHGTNRSDIVGVGVGLDVVELDGVDVLAAGQHLGVALLHLSLLAPALLAAVQQALDNPR